MKSKLEEYIDTLSETEKEKFADLIDECRKREELIDKMSNEAKQNAIQLNTAWEQLFQQFEVLKSNSEIILLKMTEVNSGLTNLLETYQDNTYTYLH